MADFDVKELLFLYSNDLYFYYLIIMNYKRSVKKSVKADFGGQNAEQKKQGYAV